MKTLVTGSTGYLGRQICLDLKQKAVEVVATGRNKKKGEQLKSLGVEFREFDLVSKSDYSDLFKEVGAVIHSAALSSPWGALNDFMEANVIATEKLIKQAIKSGCKKFVYISSTSVYFNFQDRFNIKETDSVAHPSPSYYTATKLMAEQLLKKYSNSIDIIILRPRGIFGEGDTTLIPRIIDAYDSSRLPIIGKREVELDLTYVGNVSAAAVLALETKLDSNYEIFNITNGEPVFVWDIIDQILIQTGRAAVTKTAPYFVVKLYAHFLEKSYRLFKISKEPKLTPYTAGLLAFSQTLSIDKAKKMLSYYPKVSMDEALKRTITWYKGSIK